MKKKFLNQMLNDLKSLEIKVIGSVEIFINKSEKNDYFDISLNSENHFFEFNKLLSLTNKDDVRFEFENKSNVLDTLISFLQAVKIKTQSKKVITVYLYIKNIEDISIAGDNVKLITNDIILNKIGINCANLKVETLKSKIKNLEIKSSNFKGILDYNSDNNNINISANNSDLKIKKSNFDGEILIRSNNSNYKNYAKGNAELGVLIADFNNSNIMFD